MKKPRPVYRSAADSYEAWLEKENEKAIDWLRHARRINALGVPVRDWPQECFDALMFRVKNEDMLRILGLWETARYHDPVVEDFVRRRRSES